MIDTDARGTAHVVDVDEYAACDVPIENLVVDGRVSVYEDVARKRYFDVQMRGDDLRLVAGCAVGLIPLNERVTIHVRPRVPLRNFAHILAMAEGNAVALPRLTRLYESAPEAADSVLDAVTRAFIRAVDAVRDQGLHKEYRRVVTSTSTPRGRILLGPTADMHLARGDESRVVSAIHVRTLDTAPNRLLRYTVNFLAARYRRLTGSNYRTLKAALNEMDHVLGEVLIDYDTAFLRDPRVAEPSLMPASRSAYVTAIRLAKAVLKGSGIDLPSKDDLQLESLVFRLDQIFEAYVRGALQGLARKQSMPLRVLDGNREGKKPLFDDYLPDAATPDVVIRADQGQVGVVEVKYLDRVPSRDHVNQLIAYAATYRAEQAFLIHPATENAARGLYESRSIGSTEFHFYAFDLGAADLFAEETRLTDAVFGRVLLA